MQKDVKQYVANCHTCQWTMAFHHLPSGVLHPLPVPGYLWQDISMDFVTGLPSSNGYDTIWVVVDYLTKLWHFIPCSTTIDTEGLVELLLTNIFYVHRHPETIVLDWGPQFTLQFWKYLCNDWNIEPHLSTAFHQETDGQTQWINVIMEQYLQAYFNYQQAD